MLSERSFINGITVRPRGNIEIQRATVVERDGVEVSRTYHRWNLPPGADLTGHDERVVAIAVATWTPEVIAAFNAAQDGGADA